LWWNCHVLKEDFQPNKYHHQPTFVMKTMLRIYLLAQVCLASAHIGAQPLFKVPKPTCSSVPIYLITSDMFETYHWDFGNGVTFEGYIPPVAQYSVPGMYTISLTVTSTTPFRVIDSVIITQIHPNSWVGGGFCLGEGLPDIFLEYLSYTTVSPYWARTETQDEASTPIRFGLSGVLTNAAFPLTVWDLDDGFWCGASDFLGEIIVPAGTSGGVFADPVQQLILTIKTKMVNTTTYSQRFLVHESPAQPTIICANDSLYSSYPTSNVWLAANQTTILGTGSAFHPIQAGTYYVKYNVPNCPSISEPFQYAPGCSVATEELAGNPQLLVFPNPSSGIFEIALPAGSNDRLWTCRMTDVQGKTVQQRENVTAPNNTIHMDATAQPAGIYFLQLSDGKMIYRQKITIGGA